MIFVHIYHTNDTLDFKASVSFRNLFLGRVIVSSDLKFEKLIL